MQEHPVEAQLTSAELQQYLWPGNTRADTRLAHSNASSSFRQNRRRLLASSKSSSQATDGAGMIEYRPVGYNIDGDDYASFFAKAHANTRATGKIPCPLIILDCLVGASSAFAAALWQALSTPKSLRMCR